MRQYWIWIPAVLAFVVMCVSFIVDVTQPQESELFSTCCFGNCNETEE